MKDSEKDFVADVTFECPVCGKEHTVKAVPISLLLRLENRKETGEHIQDILKDYSPVDREKFLTGYCEECQKMIFGNGD